MSFHYEREPQRVYSVSELNRQVRSLLEQGFSGVVVQGEVVAATRAASGHVYFTLADVSGTAQLNAVMWQAQARRYGRRIEKGAQIRVVGRLTIYEARGNYQLAVDMVVDAGAGAKAARFEALKRQLAGEGLFDLSRKRPLPAFPSVVGIVTSKSGAAIRDIIKVVRRRFPVHLILSHALVQGEAAPRSIVQGLDRLATCPDIDVVIIGRGGGSSEELDAFNAEVVVRRVAGFPVPIISAVGHEVDTTLVDLAADRRAATPSEAAELAVPDKRAVAESLAQERDALHLAVVRCLERADARRVSLDRRLRIHDPRARLRTGIETLARCRVSLAKWPLLTLERASSDLHRVASPLQHWPGPFLERARRALAVLDGDLRRAPSQICSASQQRLSLLATHLDAYSPLGALARGYAVVRRAEDGAILRDAAALSPGDDVNVTLHRGWISCRVTETSDES